MIAADISRAVQAHAEGRLDDAQRGYEALLALDSDNPAALNGLGVIAYQRGKFEDAITLLRRAVGRVPNEPRYLNHLGEALRMGGRHVEAVECFRQAIRSRENFPEAHNNLGLALRALGLIDEAEKWIRSAIAYRPNYADALNNLGVLLRQRGRPADALAAFVAAVERAPHAVDFRLNLVVALEQCGRVGEALQNLLSLRTTHRGPQLDKTYMRLLTAVGRSEEAIQFIEGLLRAGSDDPEMWCRYGIALQHARRFPEAADAYRRCLGSSSIGAVAANNLGGVLRLMGDQPGALSAYRKACELNSEVAEPWNNIGVLEHERGNVPEAVRLYEKALSLSPSNAEACNNLGNAMVSLGQNERAIALYTAAIKSRPEYLAAQSNRLMALLCSDRYSPNEVRQEHVRWGQRFQLPTPLVRRDGSERPGRQLRVGVLSSDFRRHPVTRFFRPLLRVPGTGTIEYVAYADLQDKDDETAAIQALFDQWVDITNLSDLDAARRIKQDNIDLLIELGGHTARSRLMICAFRPAPAQVSYLGYAEITGLPTIDFRLTDRWADPIAFRAESGEQLIHLPTCAWCYEPPDQSSRQEIVPAAPSRPLRFGSFNSLAKLSSRTVEMWAQILRRDPDSELVLKSRYTEHQWVQELLRSEFDRLEVGSRVRFLPFKPDANSHFMDYNEIDVALDPFPYHGTTTTCDAMWMGVPVVSMAGEAHVSRVGVSLLHQVGLDDLVAEDSEQYIEKALALGRNHQLRLELRSTLRERMRLSPLLDARRFREEFDAVLSTLAQRQGPRNLH